MWHHCPLCFGFNKINKKDIKVVEIGKEEVKLCLFEDNILYLKVPTHSARKLLNLINIFSKISGYKITTPNSQTRNSYSVGTAAHPQAQQCTRGTELRRQKHAGYISRLCKF